MTSRAGSCLRAEEEGTGMQAGADSHLESKFILGSHRTRNVTKLNIWTGGA